MENNSSLDLSGDDFEALLQKSSNMVLDFFDNLDQQKGFHNYSQKEIESWFDEKAPEEGSSFQDLLKTVENRVIDTATGNAGPNMYAYVMTGGTQISIVAEQFSSMINQNQGKWHLGPAVNEIEKRVVRWGAEMIGIDDKVAGVLVSGGSAANLTGLTVARNLKFEELNIREEGLYNHAPMIVYASTEVHGCIDKSMELLGLGTDNLRKIETLPDFTINTDLLKEEIKKDISSGNLPFCIIGTAGTVNTGAIDDLDTLADIADKYNLWFHVDGAYGALAAIVHELRPFYKGIERSDSIAMDFHKWLYQPFEAGCTIVNNWETLRRAYFKKADYLDTSLEEAGRLDFNEHYFQLSRNNKSLKIWMSIKAYGMTRIRDMIKKDLQLTKYLVQKIQESSDFELCSASDLAIACFRFRGNLEDSKAITILNERLIPALEADGRVFITGTKLNGNFAIRACIINHRKQEKDIDFLLNVIREVGHSLIT